MAEKKGAPGYIGRVSNAGSQYVKAPHQITPKGGKTVAIKSDKDLRGGK
jgi:hypothetical protein